MRRWDIYALLDPRNGDIRYVGWTVRLQGRIKRHVAEVVAGRARTRCGDWIRELLSVGLKPDFKVLESGCGNSYSLAERDWIFRLRSSGIDLTNERPGGEGFITHHSPDMSRELIQRKRYASKKPSREHNIWSGAKARCHNPKNPGYRLYGARGIAMCERWRNSFKTFLADVGICPPGLSLDRFPDKNGNYEPGNVRWANAIEQANNKRSNVLIEWMGRTQNISQWADELGIRRLTLRNRLMKYGMSVEDAMKGPGEKKPWKTSRFNGVSWAKRDKRWRSEIRLPGGKSVHLGWFKKEEDAAQAYNLMAAIEFGNGFKKFNTIQMGG